MPPADWSSSAFESALRQAGDWVVHYRSSLRERNVSPKLNPGEFSAAFPPQLPLEPASFQTLFRQFQDEIVPALLHWGHPGFLGYFGSTTTSPGIVAELLAAALNVSAMTWRTSPAATELETVVLGWLRELVGLSEKFTGVVYDTASVSLVHALAAAREQARPGTRIHGLCGQAGSPLRLYASDQAHSSIEKAAILLGLGEENVVRVPSDAAFALIPSSLEQAIERDLAKGFQPMAVVATVGTTSTGSVDPVAAIADICDKHRLWLHIDAAYGGAFAAIPEGRGVLAGADRADSIVINPHKWLFVPLDFSALFIQRPQRLKDVFKLVPSYLAGDASKAEVNYMDYGIQLGRRFRALKAWLVWRSFGAEGIQALIREQRRLTLLLAGKIDAEPVFERMAPVPMAVVCFRAKFSEDPDETDRFNERLLVRVNGTAKVFITSTRLRGRYVLRVGVGNILTTEEDLNSAWRVIRGEAVASAKTGIG